LKQLSKIIRKYKIVYRDSLCDDGYGEVYREEYVDDIDDVIKLLIDLTNDNISDIEIDTENSFVYE
jgi:hypothetical protein